MANDITVAQGALDDFSLGANFHAQSNSPSNDLQNTEIYDKDGQITQTFEYDRKESTTTEYKYTGSDLSTDLTLKLGAVVASGLHIDSISLAFSPTDAVAITIAGHKHTGSSNTHAVNVLKQFNLLDLPAFGGVGVPQDVITNSEANSDCVGLTMTYTLDHKDELGGNGNNALGNNFNGKLEVSAEYLGVPTLTTTGWLGVISPVAQKSNQDSDKSSFSAYKALTVYTPV